jgi:magnesium transporter
MLHYNQETNLICSEQVSLVFGHHFLLSFQEAEGDVFGPVRNRIRRGRSRIRKGGFDYLAYALIDAVVDHYFIILEKISEKIETLEEMLMVDTEPETLKLMHRLKREMIYLRQQILPVREVVHNLTRGEFNLMQETNQVFFNDVYDHIHQVIDTIESNRDLLSGMIDMVLNTLSHRMNEVMKVLTIIATVFIPITFVAGIYGMNFKYMPELDWRWGYAGVWAIIGIMVVFMLIYFKRKNGFKAEMSSRINLT